MRPAIVVILLLLAVGSAVIFWMYRGPSPPIDQVAAAKQKVQESIARSEAHRYAPDAVSSIQRNMSDIESAIAAEQKKLPFQRNYDAVLNKLNSLDAALENLESLARAMKQKLSVDVATDIDKLTATAQAIAVELSDMPSAKGSRPALTAMRGDLAALRSSIEEVQALQAAEQFQQAQQLGAQTQARAEALLQEIRETKARVRALRERSGP